MQIEKGADLADMAGGSGSDAQAGKHLNAIPIAIAIDVFQRLSGAPTPTALHDAMLGATLEHSSATCACIAVPDAGGYRIAAHTPSFSTSGNTASAILGAIANRNLDAFPTIVEHEGGSCIVIAPRAPLATMCLCVVVPDQPTQACLDIVTLIAASGAAVSHNVASKSQGEAHLALARRLNDQPSLLRTLIENMPDQIYVKDTEGRFVLGNSAAADCIGVPSPHDLIGKSDLELFPGECGLRFFHDEQTLMQSGRAIVDQLEENINQAGVRRWYSTTKVPLLDALGKVIGLVGMSRDVSLRVAADEAIGLRNRAIESSQDAIIITSCLLQGNPVVYVNPACERITGFSFDEAIKGGIDRVLAHGEQTTPQELLDAMRERSEGRAVLQSRRKDATLFWSDVRVAPVCDISGRATHFVFTMSDITKARDAEERLERMASHDALTGLPNRRMLMDRLGQAVALGERGNFVVAVAFIDLDRLKFVNDSFGHDAGDALLTTVAERMAACVRKSDTVARLGGDEFVIISLHSTTHAATQAYPHIRDMLRKIQGVLAEPLVLGDAPFRATCSIGVSLFPQHGDNADTLLKHADAAMYLAKKNGRDQIVFYAAEGEAGRST